MQREDIAFANADGDPEMEKCKRNLIGPCDQKEMIANNENGTRL